jgi:hypothetical protein
LEQEVAGSAPAGATKGEYMPIVYAGIGSRETPVSILKRFEALGEALANEGWVLRSGGAEGADSAFESGCDRVCGPKEIYIPWREFNRSDSKLFPPSPLAFEIAERFHPAWERLSVGAKKLQARNSHQVLGADCADPVKLVICYTDPHRGGTTQALRIAEDYRIPVLNFFDKEYTTEAIKERGVA